MIHPLDYSKDFLLYIAASTTTIAMVLVQENLHGQEHMIYYASKNLMDSETCYSRAEKLALAMVIAIQKFVTTFCSALPPYWLTRTRCITS